MRRLIPSAALFAVAALVLACAVGVASAQVSGSGIPGGTGASLGRAESGTGSTASRVSGIGARTITWSPVRSPGAAPLYSRRPMNLWTTQPLLLFVLRRQQLL